MIYLNNALQSLVHVFVYLSFVGCHIVNITVGSNVLPDSIQGIKITNKFQSSSCTCIRTAANYAELKAKNREGEISQN